MNDKELFDFPERWNNCLISEAPLLNTFGELWDELSGLYERELNALAYSLIPESDKVRRSINKLVNELRDKLV